MEPSAELTLTAPDLERFVMTLSGDDTFTVLYLFTKAETPLSFESLCRNYGASPIEMKDRLDCLLSLKLVYKKGHAYLASAKAIIAMESLAKRLCSAELPNVTSVSAGQAASQLTWAATGNYVSGITAVGTNNGTLLSIRVTSSATGSEAILITEQPVSQDASIEIVDLETRGYAT